MTDYAALFADNHIPFATNINRGWVNVQCPFCNDHSNNGGFNETGEYYNCWLCGGHSELSAMRRLFHCSGTEVDALLSPYRTIMPHEEKRAPQENTIQLPGTTFTPGERNYLTSRQFDPDFLSNKYGVVGGGVAGDWSYRIIIPVYFKGALVSWIGRSIMSKEDTKRFNVPRYKNLAIEKSVMDVKDIFYNMNHALGDTVILVEGPFDVLRMGDDTICSLGTSVKSEQMKLLLEYYDRVIIMFDNEPSAQAKARKLGTTLASVGMDVQVVNGCAEYGKNDPGDLTATEAYTLRRRLLAT